MKEIEDLFQKIRRDILEMKDRQTETIEDMNSLLKLVEEKKEEMRYLYDIQQKVNTEKKSTPRKTQSSPATQKSPARYTNTDSDTEMSFSTRQYLLKYGLYKKRGED
ncbi:MAG: uncharacterized protein A8A55_1217 [Amphiamblys sp. WSBS2006]|nr:MAG: uncharacterized protein A8A55_1217 [Amphiamblys sp. WSBS2006]